jgi:hypothetical protein
VEITQSIQVQGLGPEPFSGKRLRYEVKMSANNKARLVRERLIHALRRELMGPSEPQEAIPEYPTSRYLVGRLAPARAGEDDNDAEIPATENDSIGVGTAEGEDGNEDTSPPLIIGFNPSSMGLSFLIDDSVQRLRVHVTWGDYRRETGVEADQIWRRYPREGVVDGIPVGTSGAIPRTLLSSVSANVAGILISGVDDPEIALEGVVHDFAGYHAVSLFLVNRRTKGKLGDRSKDERWIYQPRLTVTTADSAPVFVAKDFRSDPLLADDDGEVATNELLYRHAREFATGHGVAVGWEPPLEDSRRTTAVYTEFIPSHEVPMLIAPSEETGDAILDMEALAKAGTPEELTEYLKPMVDAYEAWVMGISQASLAADIQADAALRDAANENVKHCRDCAARIRAGLNLLGQRHVFSAFQFANSVMWNQRIHSLWAAANRKRGKIEGSAADFDKPDNRTWRPFQIGFILLNLLGIADETSIDRRLVDLLWFPTGGGKTEAYLGLSAFTLALRRLRAETAEL